MAQTTRCEKSSAGARTGLFAGLPFATQGNKYSPDPAEICLSARTAHRLQLGPMSTVFIGTSGWAYASWKPDFYPQKLASAKFLSHYASRLNTVEVNYTFRAFPSKKLLQGWIEEAPAGFQFAIKANQKITHIKRLRDASEIAGEFISCLEPLERAKKLGPVLFQLPPYLKCDLSLLGQFLAGLRPGPRLAFEFRHPSWFSEEVFAALRERNVALCFAESDKMETPQVQTADFCYLRLRKEDYSAAALGKWKQTIADFSRHGDVFAYLKHEETPEGALHAEKLLADLNSGHESAAKKR